MHTIIQTIAEAVVIAAFLFALLIWVGVAGGAL
jgi:hypothetical protein